MEQEHKISLHFLDWKGLSFWLSGWCVENIHHYPYDTLPFWFFDASLLSTFSMPGLGRSLRFNAFCSLPILFSLSFLGVSKCFCSPGKCFVSYTQPCLHHIGLKSSRSHDWILGTWPIPSMSIFLLPATTATSIQELHSWMDKTAKLYPIAAVKPFGSCDQFAHREVTCCDQTTVYEATTPLCSFYSNKMTPIAGYQG